MQTKPSAADIAARFNCSVEQVGAQFVKNHNSLSGMYREASASGKKVNGHTSEQLRQMINALPMSK